MATFFKINAFSEALAEKVHNLGSDQLKVALINSAPSAGHTQLSSLTEISYTNCSSRLITTSSSAQSGGTYKLVLTDLVLSASGGSVGPFQTVAIFNDTATNKEIVAEFDYGSALTLASGESLTLDFDGTNGLLQLV